MRCRRQVCPECTTKIDGINHCVDCLEQAAHPRRRGASVRPPDGAIGAALLVAQLALLWLLAWGALELLLPGASS